MQQPATTSVIAHVDEKWFYSVNINKRIYLIPGEKTAAVPISSRHFINKVMFIACIARPMLQYGFDGKVYFAPVVQWKQARRSSKNLQKGAMYMTPTTMDVALFIEEMKRITVALLSRISSFATEAVLQFDNAGGHGGGKGSVYKTTIPMLQNWVSSNPPELQSVLTGRQIDIKFVAQPPHSPDLNMLDLGAWHSLDCEVDTLRMEHSGCIPTQELINACTNAWARWDGGRCINALFDELHHVYEAVVGCNGGNDYLMPHKKESN